jgi:hypothetical protein
LRKYGEVKSTDENEKEEIKKENDKEKVEETKKERD